jgi:hypothetical protein
MDLQSGLRRQHHARAASDMHRLPEDVTAEDAGSRADDDHVRRAMKIEPTADAERRLRVGMYQDRPVIARLERELEAAASANVGRIARVARLKASRSRCAVEGERISALEGEPFRRAYDS